MQQLSESEFDQLIKQGYNRIPLVQKVLADFDTPLGVFLKVANQPFSYLFESVQGGERWGRYSIVGLSCHKRLEVVAERLTIYKNNSKIKELNIADPLAYIGEFQSQFKVPKLGGLPRFNGGLVGFMGYECINYIEPKLKQLAAKEDELQLPDIVLMLSDDLVVMDNLNNQVYVIAHASAGEYQPTLDRLQKIVSQLQQPLLQLATVAPGVLTEDDFVSSYGKEKFIGDVEKIKTLIGNGECMQVVLSQRYSANYTAGALNLYRSLRILNPSPYMYYLDMGSFQLVGSSPEILVRLEDEQVTVRPIAGTRVRGKNMHEDQRLERELLKDPKELAEHLMLIDLGRNDLGKICQVDSIEVTDSMFVERYSHVMHIVSNVQGLLAKSQTTMDVLRACFPAGTVSGAPKIRAMEIINQHEPVKRAAYSGAIGYFGWHNNLDTAIAIRTAVVKNNKLYVQAGAGIVYDSDPESEWQETLNKSRALFSAAAMAAAGLK